MQSTRTVEVQVPVTKPVPAELTNPLDYPPALSQGFSIQDVVELDFTLYDLLDQCQADRAKVKSITTPTQ